MKNFWLGEKSISKTFFVIVIPLIIYLYLVTSETFYNNLSKVGIQSIAMEIFLKIFGVILSLFATANCLEINRKKNQKFFNKIYFKDIYFNCFLIFNLSSVYNLDNET
jgi:hypothetical protein